jgi:hypothetical protein
VACSSSSITLEFLVEPAAGVLALFPGEAGFQFPVGARYELADAFLPLHDDGQGRGLHPAHGGQVETAGLGVEGGHGPGAVDADQPVAFRAADGGGAQAGHFAGVAQGGETVADGALGHGLQPQAPHRLLAAAMLGDVIEDQLALAARVTGVDQAVHILALDQLGQQLEAVLGLLDGGQGEMGRDDRQMGEGPFAPLDLVFLGHRQFQQVADGGGEHVVLGLEVVLFLVEAAQHAGDVLGDRRLLGNDELFGHGSVQSGLPAVFAVVLVTTAPGLPATARRRRPSVSRGRAGKSI